MWIIDDSSLAMNYFWISDCLEHWHFNISRTLENLLEKHVQEVEPYLFGPRMSGIRSWIWRWWYHLFSASAQFRTSKKVVQSVGTKYGYQESVRLLLSLWPRWFSQVFIVLYQKIVAENMYSSDKNCFFFGSFLTVDVFFIVFYSLVMVFEKCLFWIPWKD